ncbi:GNAT family N-acetyltransferase [Companilactobacillus sp. DQM5]|uniref:GNAT family N-acetyltransferase n=1 Tax=Companilactobacillus sp. DQM5 TaxID=3463359 RepID=UPI004059D275
MIITNKDLNKEDYKQIANVWLESNIESQDFINKKYWLSNLGYVKNAMQKSKIFAYKIDDEIQGFIGLNDDYIEGIFVKKEYRKHGIGKKLLEQLKREHDLLKLFVYKKNEVALQFYLSNGFTIFNESIEDETGEISVSMVWKK